MLLQVDDGVDVDMTVLRKDRIERHTSSVSGVDKDVSARKVDALSEVACVVVTLWAVASSHSDGNVSVG